MNKSELFNIVRTVKTVDELKANEEQLIKAVTATVELELMPLQWIGNADVQMLVNKTVNAFAVSLRDEIGIRDAESMKVLERVRIVSERTIQRDKKQKGNAAI